jgi:hypothetical protein
MSMSDNCSQDYGEQSMPEGVFLQHYNVKWRIRRAYV